MYLNLRSHKVYFLLSSGLDGGLLLSCPVWKYPLCHGFTLLKVQLHFSQHVVVVVSCTESKNLK